ncbi:hypothetical protein MNBD_NITROSPINAE03-842, partial [hydrothermal vent metagenome]
DREMGGAEAFINRGIKYTPIFTISEIRDSQAPTKSPALDLHDK